MFPFAVPGKVAPVTHAGPADAAALLARAPKLRDPAERIVAALVKSLQKMAGAHGLVDGAVGGLALRDLREVVAAQAPTGIAAAIQCPSVPCTILVTLDAMLVHGLVDLLCGGAGKELAPAMPRDATPIDQQFVQIVVQLLAGAIEAEWAEAGFGKASAARVDSLTPDVLGPRIREIGCVDVKIVLFGLAGTIRLGLPPAALDRFAADDLGEPAPAAPDGVWSNLFRRELGQAPVRVDAYLDAKNIDLGALSALKIGQVIDLQADARVRASLVSQGRVLFRGEVGQADEHYSLRIDDVVPDALRQAAASPSRLQASEPLRL